MQTKQEVKVREITAALEEAGREYEIRNVGSGTLEVRAGSLSAWITADGLVSRRWQDGDVYPDGPLP